MKAGSRLYLWLSGLLLLALLTLLGLLLSFPWFPFPRALYVVLQIGEAFAAFFLPFAFFFGYGARKAEMRALAELQSEAMAALRLVTETGGGS